MAIEPRQRFVLDVDTLVSAYLFPQSLPGHSLEFVLREHTLLMSLEIGAELADVLRRDKFDRYVRRERREELLAGTIRDSHFIVTRTAIAVCRDPDDNMLLELAIDGKALAIVSGDADLLTLNPYEGISIVTPRDFLSRFATAE